MEKSQFSFAGKIIKTFGYKGELLFHIEDAFCKKIKKTEFVFVEIAHERVPFFIVSIENQKGSVFSVKLEDLDTIEKARQLTGCSLYLLNSDKIKVASHDFEIRDLVGFEVTDADYGKMGKITQLLELPQQHIMQIFIGKKEVLIPFNEHTVMAIDVENKTIDIRAPEGLIDFYLK